MKKLLALVMTLGVLAGASGCKDNREKVFRDGMSLGSTIGYVEAVNEVLADSTFIDTIKKANLSQSDLYAIFIKEFKERFETSEGIAAAKEAYQEYVKNNYNLN
jgi:hypothetical protein